MTGPSGYTPSGFASSPGREAEEGFSDFITTKKKKEKGKKK